MQGQGLDKDAVSRLPLVPNAIDDAVTAARKHIHDGFAMPMSLRVTARWQLLDIHSEHPARETNSRLDERSAVVALVLRALDDDVTRAHDRRRLAELLLGAIDNTARVLLVFCHPLLAA